MFVRRTAKTAVYRRIQLGHTSEKIMVSVQNVQVLVFNLLHLLVAANRGVFRTWSNIYNGALLRKYLRPLSC